MILIVGLGRSGTSYIAECFQGAGVDPGGAWEAASNAGWEHMPIHAYCGLLIREGVRFPDCDEAQRLLGKHGPPLRKLCDEAPHLVKTPLFLPLLELFVHLGVVDRIIWAKRPVDKAIQSIQAWGLEAISWPYVRAGEVR